MAPYDVAPLHGLVHVAGRDGAQVFNNWDPYVNEAMTLPTALAGLVRHVLLPARLRFYKLPPSAGHPLQAWAARFGFGKATGVDVGPEAAGLLPTPEWKRRHAATDNEIDKLWKPGDSIQLAIGQKDLLVTPLQMARFYALIANGGKLVTPHLVEDVRAGRRRGGRTGAASLAPLPPPPQPIGVDPGALAVVRDGLYQATHASVRHVDHRLRRLPDPDRRQDRHGGEGHRPRRLRRPGRPVLVVRLRAGATAPELVVCALIENGGLGGEAAAPAALQGLREYFAQATPGSCDGGGRLMVDYVVTRERSRARARVERSRVAPLCAGSTGCCSARSPRSSATGSGRSTGSRATTSPATRDYFVMRQAVIA